MTELGIRGLVCVLFALGSAACLQPTTVSCKSGIICPQPSGNPPARYQHALAYDPVRGRGVLFGGFGDLPYQNHFHEKPASVLRFTARSRQVGPITSANVAVSAGGIGTPTSSSSPAIGRSRSARPGMNDPG